MLPWSARETGALVDDQASHALYYLLDTDPSQSVPDHGGKLRFKAGAILPRSSGNHAPWAYRLLRKPSGPDNATAELSPERRNALHALLRAYADLSAHVPGR